MIALLLHAPEGILWTLPTIDAKRTKRASIFAFGRALKLFALVCSNMSKVSANHSKIRPSSLPMVGEMQFSPDQVATRRVQIRAKVECTFSAFLAEAAK